MELLSSCETPLLFYQVDTQKKLNVSFENKAFIRLFGSFNDTQESLLVLNQD